MYFIITILFVVYIIWSWRSTEEFETPIMRILYIVIGTAFIIFVNLILFYISKIGITYPKEEMIGETRKIILLIFTPINGFVVLTQFASIFTKIKSGIISKEEMSKKLKIIFVIIAVLIILECIYFKNIQNGLIDVINARR